MATRLSVLLRSIPRIAPSPAIRTLQPTVRFFADKITYPAPIARVTAPAPEFTAGAVVDGEIKQVKLSDYRGKWVVLFFYPKDFTFVCPTEIIAFSDRAKEFEALNAQLIAASTDTVNSHLAWIRTPRKKGGLGLMQIPIIEDPTRAISNQYGVLIEEAGIALRGLFIINPEGNIDQITINNLPVGRSVDETLRLLQAFQFVRKHGEVCPANWTAGSKTMKADPDASLEYFSTVADAPSGADTNTGNVKTVKSSAELKKFTDASTPTVAYYYAPWCGKCALLSPFIANLSTKYSKVNFVKIDTSDDAFADPNSKLVLPTVKFFQNGKETHEAVIGYKKNLIEQAVSAL